MSVDGHGNKLQSGQRGETSPQYGIRGRGQAPAARAVDFDIEGLEGAVCGGDERQRAGFGRWAMLSLDHDVTWFGNLVQSHTL